MSQSVTSTNFKRGVSVINCIVCFVRLRITFRMRGLRGSASVHGSPSQAVCYNDFFNSFINMEMTTAKTVEKIMVKQYMSKVFSSAFNLASVAALSCVIGFTLKVPFLRFLMVVDHLIKIIDINEPKIKNPGMLRS